jgi:hypothetical protein
VELPPKWFVRSESHIPEHFPFVCFIKKTKQTRVDYVEQVEEILAATQAKGARLFRRPKMSASVDRCVSPMAEPCSFFFAVAALDKLHAKHVLPGFADRSSEEREIEVATSEVTKVN